MTNNESVQKLQQYAQNVIANCTAPINQITETIIQSTSVTPGNSHMGLSMDDLCAIAIRLPAECAFLQSQINAQLITQKLQAFMTETHITDCIVQLQNTKGDAKERQRRAEAMNKEEVLSDVVAEQIVAALQATVQRADKVYEGVKKIIDAKTREANFDRKPGYPIA